MAHVYRTHWISARRPDKTACGSMVSYKPCREDLPVSTIPAEVTCWQCRHAFNFPKED